MKSLVQFVAVLAIALLAVQPAVAGLPCEDAARTTCAPGCPMSMNGMGLDCPMASRMAAGACSENCCGHALPQVTAPLAVAEGIKLAASAAPSMLPGSISITELVIARWTPIEARFTSPPRHILYQVFRI